MLRFDPWLRCRNLEWARRSELRPDAHDCIMVRVPRGNLPDTRLRRDEPRPYGKLPSIVRTVRHLSLTKRSKQKASHCRSGLDTNQPHTRIIGVWLFSLQHRFEGVHWSRRKEWKVAT